MRSEPDEPKDPYHHHQLSAPLILSQPAVAGERRIWHFLFAFCLLHYSPPVIPSERDPALSEAVGEEARVEGPRVLHTL